MKTFLVINVPLCKQSIALESLQNELSHWNVKDTQILMTDQFWRSNMYACIDQYDQLVTFISA